VIGGGDRATDRIVPDVVRALGAGAPVAVRNPESVRPWQHVLEPVGGYLLLGARLLGAGTGTPAAFCQAWNFGPDLVDSRAVRDLVEAAIRAWGSGSWHHRPDPAGPREAGVLRLAIEKAATRLGWRPRWSFEEAVEATVAWYREQAAGAGSEALRALAERQIAAYEERA
jgi:CDP-glucose 4,6-dehydratase